MTVSYRFNEGYYTSGAANNGQQHAYKHSANEEYIPPLHAETNG